MTKHKHSEPMGFIKVVLTSEFIFFIFLKIFFKIHRVNDPSLYPIHLHKQQF